MKTITIKTQNNRQINNIILMKNTLGLAKGLMFKNKGRALLKLPFSARHSIWMLFMKFNLDLIFIDKKFQIADIIENAIPVSFNSKTWKTYLPKQKCKYVLEIEAGLSKKINLKKKDFIKII